MLRDFHVLNNHAYVRNKSDYMEPIPVVDILMDNRTSCGRQDAGGNSGLQVSGQ